MEGNLDTTVVNGGVNRSGKLCKYFMNNGYCFYGDNCQFLHSRGPVGEEAITVVSSGSSVALLPGVANVPVQLHRSKSVGNELHSHSRSAPNSPKKGLGINDGNEHVSKHLQRLKILGSPNARMNQQGGSHHQYGPFNAGHFNAGSTPYFMNQSRSPAVKNLQFSVPDEFSLANGSEGIPTGYQDNRGFPKKNEKSTFFASQQIRQELQRQQAMTAAQPNPEDKSLPSHVDAYHSLVPLEDVKRNDMNHRSMGYITSSYKAVSSKDGNCYCLRRVHGFRLLHPKSVNVVDQWKKLQNTNIVSLKEVFTTKAFGDTSLVFVYTYYPGAETLMARHFAGAYSPSANVENFGGLGQNWNGLSSVPFSKISPQRFLPERLIWSYIIQVTSAIRSVHGMGLACRLIDPTKILLIGNFRLRLNCLGILDILTYDANANSSAVISHYQGEDLAALGKLILALACYSLDAIQRENLQQSIDYVSRNYSNDLKSLIWHLLGAQTPSPNHMPKTINDVMPVIGARFYSQLDVTQARADLMEGELAKEMENGRLLRVLCKLGTILERPEFNMDLEWSETGDRYLLKLFRDYVFHQVTETGASWVDLAHIVTCLNKLDAGSPERICLTSRDEQSVLVVSYRDLKACLETAFKELMQATDEAQ